MQLLFIDYTNLVIEAYEKKRNADQLSRLLLQPTTAGIRQACLNVYNERVRKGEDIEENTLTDFFGVPPAGKKTAYHIERYPADKFRPIQTLMKRGIKNPSLPNVELLAWLIDFTPRPLAKAQKILEGTTEPIIPNPPIIPPTDITQKPEQAQTGNNGDCVTEPSDTNSANRVEDIESNMPTAGNKDEGKNFANNQGKKSRNKLKIAASAGLIAAALFGGGYSIWQYEGRGDISYGNTNPGCMYWSGDHYEPISCNEKPNGRFILPLNEEKMKSFKKIMKKDTMTKWSIGKAYYIKNNNIIEYFTTAGTHPVFVTDTLKVLSPYMFDKYLRKKEAPGKDSFTE